MNIERTEAFEYELGVLLFNLVANHKHSLKVTNGYDVMGNVVTLWNTLADINEKAVKVGFVAECQNYDITEEEAKKLFEEVIVQVRGEIEEETGKEAKPRKTVLENRKQAIALQIADTQKQIHEVVQYVIKDGVDKIFSNHINTVMPSLVQLQHKLSLLEVELQTLNSFEYYKEELLQGK